MEVLRQTTLEKCQNEAGWSLNIWDTWVGGGELEIHQAFISKRAFGKQD